MKCPHCPGLVMEFHKADDVPEPDKSNPDHRDQWFCRNCWLHLDATEEEIKTFFCLQKYEALTINIFTPRK